MDLNFNVRCIYMLHILELIVMYNACMTFITFGLVWSVIVLYSIRFCVGLYWYQKGTNNKWGYDLIDHSMLDIEKIIAIPFKAYITELNAYKLHPGGWKSLQQLY